ncbi:MAG: hypothetical protein GXP10_04110 [Gammaproteobacteria bacterium]|nr:hypothetical protein [Gammaproteobacteria bacterium]
MEFDHHTLPAQRTTCRRLATCALLLFCASIGSESYAAKCLFVASYHRGYEWNDGIERGVDNTLKGRCELYKFFMDTKRNKGVAFAERKALEAKAYIEKIEPDVVIAADDNASKYLVKPYFKDARLPFVFCGINWTAQPYGYPYSNATGIIEVAPIRPLLKAIRQIVDQPGRGVYLSADVLTERKDYQRYRESYAKKGIVLQGVFAKTMQAWREQYIAAQAQEIDFIVLNNNSGINDWDSREAVRIAQRYNHVLTVTNYDWMMQYAMFAMTKLPEEQGEWAAQVALAILDGEPAASIPIITNRRWNIFANPQLLEKANIQLPAHLMHKAIKVASTQEIKEAKL